MKNPGKTANALIHESSPYLLQHAYNPVHWLPFGDKAFQLARELNKPVLVSIGYSACHWCHVMEHESFENDQVAALMNEHFINIKVDREERSDVDMIYMQAVQLMSGQGGWPLNCFVMPDGRPFYGGTYFHKKQWIQVLQAITELWQNQYAKVEEYAAQLTQGIRESELFFTERAQSETIRREAVIQSAENWKKRFDNHFGGPDKAPKFPLPNNYQFLLRYGSLQSDREVLDHVHLTLRAMAAGGIYDQLRGGFSRYSTDMLWKVPHFEKMLYDNAQLMSLYSEAYRHSPAPLYRKVVEETMRFVKEEWMTAEGGFYSAFDADSEGEEGKYYVWTKEELRDLLKEDFDVFCSYYHVDEKGYWEHGNYILMLNESAAEIAVASSLTMDELSGKIENCKKILRKAAENREKPGLDDKIITSWNAMMCSACAKAWLSFRAEEYRSMAIDSITFITSRLMNKEGQLWHTYKNGTARIGGFLDDYAFVTEALIQVYLITQNEDYILKARDLNLKAIEIFDHPGSPLLYYTDDQSTELISRSTETQDNVIPASNSQMALNLYSLGTYFNEPAWVDRAGSMVSLLSNELKHYGSAYSNWACLALQLAWPSGEVAIVGKDVDEKLLNLHSHWFTNAILAVSSNDSGSLPLVKNRFREGETLLYVCENNVCQLPVKEVAEALNQLNSK